jgi:hypothetical protein
VQVGYALDVCLKEIGDNITHSKQKWTVSFEFLRDFNQPDKTTSKIKDELQA